MTSLRDCFLEECCKKKLGVTVIVQNGYQIKGVVVAFDESVVLFSQNDGMQMLIYHSAISSILPYGPISITERNTRQ